MKSLLLLAFLLTAYFTIRLGAKASDTKESYLDENEGPVRMTKTPEEYYGG